MRKWICTVCKYVYDPETGDPEGGIPPGTAFEELPDDWLCPVCKLLKSVFEPLEEQMELKKVPDAGADLTGRALDLEGLAQYQKDSVVSRTLVNKKAGTVTLFAFDKGQGLSEHTAPYDAMVIILDGEAEITISGKKTRVGKGSMIIMPADQPHALDAVERFKMLLVMIRS